MYKCKEIYPGKMVTIVFLSNALYYFIEWAMIVYEKDGYRLLVYLPPLSISPQIKHINRLKLPGRILKKYINTWNEWIPMTRNG